MEILIGLKFKIQFTYMLFVNKLLILIINIMITKTIRIQVLVINCVERLGLREKNKESKVK